MAVHPMSKIRFCSFCGAKMEVGIMDSDDKSHRCMICILKKNLPERFEKIKEELKLDTKGIDYSKEQTK